MPFSVHIQLFLMGRNYWIPLFGFSFGVEGREVWEAEGNIQPTSARTCLGQGTWTRPVGRKVVRLVRGRQSRTCDSA